VTRPRRARRLVRAIGLAALVAGSPCLGPRRAAASAGCPTPPAAGPQLGSVDPSRRLVWLEERLTYAEHKARLWTFGWGGGIAAAGVASLAAVPFVAPENRVDWYTGAVSAAVGVAAIAIAPPVVLKTMPALRVELARATLPDGVCSLLTVAESDLVRVARDEEQQGAWYVHVGNVLFNVGLGLFLGLGYHHWEAGAINAAVGTAVGEALILTRPTAAIHDLDAYLAGVL
jgi:hypothetical protein